MNIDRVLWFHVQYIFLGSICGITKKINSFAREHINIMLAVTCTHVVPNLGPATYLPEAVGFGSRVNQHHGCSSRITRKAVASEIL